MRVIFSTPDRPGKDNHVANYDVVLDPMPEIGNRQLKIAGGAIWRGTKENNQDELYVTVAGRVYEKDGEEHKFDYIRSARGEYEDVRALKDWVLEQYKQQAAAAA